MDARISIAIFAAISVTAGYFALGKIEKIRNASIMKELMAIETAMKEVQTDIGTFYRQAVAESNGTDDFKILWDISYMSENFKRLWNGPYITEETTNHSILGSYSIEYYRDDMSSCEDKGECYAFIAVTETPKKVWDSINSYVDESNGSQLEKKKMAHLMGKVRSLVLSDPRTLLYKTVHRKVRK